MSRRAYHGEPVQGCFPRVSGDEPEYQELGTLLGAFSPRERG